MISRFNDIKNNFDDIKSLVKKNKNYSDIKVNTINKHIDLEEKGVINITVDVNVGVGDGEDEIIGKKNVENMVQSIAKAVLENTKENMPFPKNIIISSKEGIIDDIDIIANNNYKDVDLNLVSLVTPKHQIKNLLLSKELKNDISKILTIYNNSKQAAKMLNTKPFIKGSKSIVCNFYGLEGMGKVTVAQSIANEINKKVLSFSYNELISIPIVDTPKTIRAIFDFAKKNNAVLIIKEGDSLIRDNCSIGKSDDAQSDLVRSIIKEEILKFDSIVFFICQENTDILDYFKSVILIDSEFRLPNEEEREKLWEHYISNYVELSPILTPKILSQKFTDVTLLEIKSILFLATCISIENYRTILYESDFDTAYEQVKYIY